MEQNKDKVKAPLYKLKELMENNKLTQLKGDFAELTRHIYYNIKAVDLSDARELLIKIQEVEKGVDELIEHYNKPNIVSFTIQGEELVGILNKNKGTNGNNFFA